MAETNLQRGFDRQRLWEKYEDIAMHFNDLLMRLRTQSLAGVAALSTLVGVFTKGGPGTNTGWLVAGAVFTAMALFWMAICCVDITYYNRLLRGAVTALKRLEYESKPTALTASEINMSTLIEAEFNEPLVSCEAMKPVVGILVFYATVFVTLACGAWFCFQMHAATP
jgi:hypothetical protein